MNAQNFDHFQKYFENLNGMIIIKPTKEMPDINALINHDGMMEKILHEKGALLLRNFSIDSAEKFKEIALIFARDLMSNNGEHIPLSTTHGVYTPVSYSPKEKLLWHNENSFNHVWPLMIMFGAARPAEIGGETPVVDSRKVLAALDAEVVDEFSKKGVMYVRTHGCGFGRTWAETYHTDDKNELEKKCKEQNIQMKWLNQNELITKQVRPAIIKHPITGELSWFNQAQHWHPYCLKPEVREYLMKMFPEDHLPRNCYFGDGTPIPDEFMQHILDIYEKLEVSFSWKKGDVMILDNVLFAHARNPYSGERKLFVTMGKHACFSNTTETRTKLI